MMHKVEVGKPFPGAYPTAEGATLEVGPDGDLNLLIQFPRPTPAELNALLAGFTRYAYCDASKSALACWVWKFPTPLGYLDTPFHGGLYPDDRILKLIESKSNRLMVYVLDGPTVQVIRLIGLSYVAAGMFYATLSRQTRITPPEYNAAVDWLNRMEPKQIYEAGAKFIHAVEA